MSWGHVSRIDWSKKSISLVTGISSSSSSFPPSSSSSSSPSSSSSISTRWRNKNKTKGSRCLGERSSAALRFFCVDEEDVVDDDVDDANGANECLLSCSFCLHLTIASIFFIPFVCHISLQKSSKSANHFLVLTREFALHSSIHYYFTKPLQFLIHLDSCSSLSRFIKM